ncbi:hypothetical protein GJ496_001384 [Pomphorhynchus laevis]|nr:hypothetical protein GJ496_001384 [Pomphorhynchus laevis]
MSKVKIPFRSKLADAINGVGDKQTVEFKIAPGLKVANATVLYKQNEEFSDEETLLQNEAQNVNAEIAILDEDKNKNRTLQKWNRKKYNLIDPNFIIRDDKGRKHKTRVDKGNKMVANVQKNMITQPNDIVEKANPNYIEQQDAYTEWGEDPSSNMYYVLVAHPVYPVDPTTNVANQDQSPPTLIQNPHNVYAEYPVDFMTDNVAKQQQLSTKKFPLVHYANHIDPVRNPVEQSANLIQNSNNESSAFPVNPTDNSMSVPLNRQSNNPLQNSHHVHHVYLVNSMENTKQQNLSKAQNFVPLAPMAIQNQYQSPSHDIIYPNFVQLAPMTIQDQYQNPSHDIIYPNFAPLAPMAIQDQYQTPSHDIIYPTSFLNYYNNSYSFVPPRHFPFNVVPAASMANLEYYLTPNQKVMYPTYNHDNTTDFRRVDQGHRQIYPRSQFGRYLPHKIKYNPLQHQTQLSFNDLVQNQQHLKNYHNNMGNQINRNKNALACSNKQYHDPSKIRNGNFYQYPHGLQKYYRLQDSHHLQNPQSSYNPHNTRRQRNTRRP